MRLQLLIGFFGLCMLLCTAEESIPNQNASNSNLNATLWMQTSLEYAMNCQQTYTLAKLQLEKAKKNPLWTAYAKQKNNTNYHLLPSAIIMDIDETILDNSPYQARLIYGNKRFSRKSWKLWVSEQKAAAIPGSIAFIKYAYEQNIKIIFITNREHDEKQDTWQNLKKTIDPRITIEQILCKKDQPNWGSDKTSRRELVAQKHRILMLIGDDANDIHSFDNSSFINRKKDAKNHLMNWGKKWFILPNPTYGHWERFFWPNKNENISINEKKLQYLKRKES